MVEKAPPDPSGRAVSPGPDAPDERPCAGVVSLIQHHMSPWMEQLGGPPSNCLRHDLHDVVLERIDPRSYVLRPVCFPDQTIGVFRGPRRCVPSYSSYSSYSSISKAASEPMTTPSTLLPFGGAEQQGAVIHRIVDGGDVPFGDGPKANRPNSFANVPALVGGHLGDCFVPGHGEHLNLHFPSGSVRSSLGCGHDCDRACGALEDSRRNRAGQDVRYRASVMCADDDQVHPRAFPN
jgi:hypothetical protein